MKLQKLREYHSETSKAIGFPTKDKEKNLRSLEQEISRLEEENKYLSTHFELEKESSTRAIDTQD